MLGQKFLLGRMVLSITILGLVAKPVLAATGAITLGAGTAVLIDQRTSNITGPIHVPENQFGHYTATFPSGTNNQSGSFTALLSSDSDPDAVCVFSFVTVDNGHSCTVSVANTGTTAVCSFSNLVVNPSTCDFSVRLSDNLKN